MATFVAMKPEEAVGEDPAFEIRTELLLDEARHRAIAFSGARKECLELLANDAVQLGLFRAMSFVASYGACGKASAEREVGGDFGIHSWCALREACRAVCGSLLRSRGAER